MILTLHSISKDGNIYVASSHVLYMLGSVYKLALKPFSVCSKEHSSFFIILSVFTIAVRFEGVGMIIICDFFYVVSVTFTVKEKLST